MNPRGEGTTFQQRVRARMAAALEQSRGAWLPVTFPEASLEHAIAGRPAGVALVLDQGARPLLDALTPAASIAGTGGGGDVAITLAVGPEGGFEPAELAALEAAGFARVALGANILRFETAALAGLSVVRSFLERADTAADGRRNPSEGAE